MPHHGIGGASSLAVRCVGGTCRKVMDMMVGNPRAPGATILGGGLEYLICQPSFCVPRRVLYFVMDNPVDSVTTAFAFDRSFASSRIRAQRNGC